MKKAIVFVDANNFYHCVKKIISPSVLDINKIVGELCKIKDFNLIDIYWYASIPDINDGIEQYDRHRGFLLELEKRGVKVVRRKLQKVSKKEMDKKKNFIFSKVSFCESCKSLFSKYLNLFFSDKKEKGIDVWCAVDMIDKSCMKDECDVCILISGDADFVPALELIERESKKVLVASPHFGFSKELRDKFEYFILKEEILTRCLREKNQLKTSQKPVKDERKKLIFEAIKTKRFTSRFFVKEIGVNRSTVESDLNELKKEGLIEFTGSASGGYWEVLR